MLQSEIKLIHQEQFNFGNGPMGTIEEFTIKGFTMDDERLKRWLNKYERMENEELSVALIFCAEKSDEVIELLELDKGDIRVAQYLTSMPSKEVLEEKLHLAIQRAKIQLEQRRE